MSNFDEATYRREQKAERASDLAGDLIALRSAWLFEERSRNTINAGKVASLQSEQSSLHVKRREFYSLSIEELESLIVSYTEQLKQETAEYDAYVKAKGYA